MHEFWQQVFSGLAAGSVYASVALALVMIYRSTDLVNFAQGEMAMFSTYIAWTLVNAGMPFWGAFAVTLIVSFVGGMVIERVVIRPVENAPVLAAVVVTIGLLLIFNSVAGWIYTYTVQDFPSPFPDRPLFHALITTRDLGVIAVTLIMLVLLFLFFRFTSTGLAMRAAAQILPRPGYAEFASDACSRSDGGSPPQSARPRASWSHRFFFLIPT